MKKKSIATLLAITMLIALAVPTTAYALPTEVERIAGATRYETAVKISQKEFKESIYAILASGENYADALAGGQLAVILRAPILLTPSNKLDAGVEAELARLKVEKVYILGGEKTITKTVENDIQSVYKVERISGKDRYETSLKIVDLFRSLSKSESVIYADGAGFADALAAGTLVSSGRYCLALSKKEVLPTLTASYELVLGGTGSLPLPDYKGERVAGKDRYETGLKIAQKANQEIMWKSDVVVLVDGTNYPDALAAISILANHKAYLLLTDPNALDPATKEFIKENAYKVVVVGGTNSVSEAVITDLLRKSDPITIAYEKNDGSGERVEIAIEVAEKVKAPIFKRKNHTFHEWNTKLDGSGDTIFFEAQHHTTDLTVFAIWKPVTDPSFFTMYDWVDSIIIKGYRDDGPKEVVIPETVIIDGNEKPVTQISKEVFKNKAITQITLPQSLAYLDEGTFAMNKLKTLILNEGLKNVSKDCFRENEIEEIVFPSSIWYVSRSAFYKNKLKEVTFTADLAHIGEFAFASNQIERISFDGKVISIYESAFGANKIKHLMLPDGLSLIGKRAFDKNPLETVYLPESIEKIEEEAFRYHKLKKVRIPQNVEVIEKHVFADGELEEIIIPQNVETIAEGAFKNNKLKSVSIPDSVKLIKANAFANNNLLEVEVKTGCVVDPNAFDAGVTVKLR